MYQIGDTNQYFSEQGLSRKDWENQWVEHTSSIIGLSSRTELVKLVSIFASNLVYYNSQNRIDGDWSAFFRNEPHSAILLLGSFDKNSFLSKQKQLILELRQTSSQTDYDRLLLRVIDGILLEFQTLIELIQVIQEMPHVFSVVDGLIEDRVRDVYWGLISFREPLGDVGVFKPARRKLIFRRFEKNQSLDIFNGPEKLERLIFEIANVFDEISLVSQSYFDNSLAVSGNIPPHLGMFLVFHKLFGYIEEITDTGPRVRIHDYYIRSCGFQRNEARQDYAYFKTNLKDDDKMVLLPKDTEIEVEQTNGEPLIYGIEEETYVFSQRLTDVLVVDFLGSREKSFTAQKDVKISRLSIHPRQEQTKLNLGLKISSSYLRLNEGDRLINFNFHLDEYSIPESLRMSFTKQGISDVRERLNKAVNVSFSSLKGDFDLRYPDIELDLYQDKANREYILRLGCLVTKSMPSVEPHEDEENVEPHMKMYFSSKDMDLYSIFSTVRFTNVNLSVDIIGIKNLVLQNDYGIISTGSPFEPFGPIPQVGSRIFIGHSLFSYPLNKLLFNLEWMGLPMEEGGFPEYYDGYTFASSNEVFQFKISALRNKEWQPAQDRQLISLFQNAQDQATNQELEAVSNIRRMSEIDVNKLGLNEIPKGSEDAEMIEFSVDSVNGFIQFELAWPPPAFGHEEFPSLLQQSALLLSKKRRNQALMPTIQKPYTPCIKELSCDLSFKVNLTEDNARISNITPFDSKGFGDKKANVIFPRFSYGSTIYIGLEEKQEIVSLFFEISHSQKNRELSLNWSVLGSNDWLPVSNSDVIIDETQNLIETGLMVINLKEYRGFVNSNSLWLKLECNRNGSFSDLIKRIDVQNIKAFLLNPSDRIGSTTAPTQKVQLRQSNDNVSSLELNTPSIKGRARESTLNFQLRCSDLLRHKGKGVSNRDIARIILAEFPEVGIVKCLNHTSKECELKPGEILVTVIPASNILSGTKIRFFSVAFLEEIQAYLGQHMAVGDSIQVVNPKYDKVRFKFNVILKSGFDERYFLSRLNKDLIDYLDPWSDQSSEGIRFGETINSSTVLNFLEKLSYVDHILNFSTFHIVDDIIQNLEMAKSHNTIVTPSSPISVIVSDVKHDIYVVERSTFTDKSGINEMMLETDFVIQEDNSANQGLNFSMIGKNFEIGGEDYSDDGSLSVFQFNIN